jgi:hypothetical protein
MKRLYLLIEALADYALTKSKDLEDSRDKKSESTEFTGGAYRNRTDVHGFASTEDAEPTSRVS